MHVHTCEQEPVPCGGLTLSTTDGFLSLGYPARTYPCHKVKGSGVNITQPGTYPATGADSLLAGSCWPKAFLECEPRACDEITAGEERTGSGVRRHPQRSEDADAIPGRGVSGEGVVEERSAG